MSGSKLSRRVTVHALENRGLKKDKFIQEADFTPSGVERLAKLQLAGHAYIKP